MASATGIRGDLNLDGIPFSIADLVMLSLYSRYCAIDPGPWPPPDVQEQADVDCDGEDNTITDLNRLMTTAIGIIQPEECASGSTPTLERRTAQRPTATSEVYSVEISDLLIAGADTGWIEIVLLEAPDVMTGFQFSFEYDTDRLELLLGMIGDGFASTWWNYDAPTVAGKSCVRAVGHMCYPWRDCPTSITLPELPAMLAKFKFRVSTPDEDFATSLKFTWNYCHDNGISVGPENEDCGYWPDYLAVSNNVYDAAGNDITGTDVRYGGAGVECLVGGTRDIPVRQIDFYSGTLTYQQSCCIDRVGDANSVGGDEPTIGDVATIIDAKFIRNNCDEITCLLEADINQSGGSDPTCDDITLGDLAILIDYLFITGQSLGLPPCP